MINKSNIGELSIEQKDFKVIIKQKEENVTQVVSAPPQLQPVAFATPPTTLASAPLPASSSAAPSAEKSKATEAPSTNHVTIKSPMIGTFYRKSAPEKANFVEPGDDIVPGKVVCIIEAMKLFNEIESEISGKLVKVLVEDASPVEYDQPLFLVEPA